MQALILAGGKGTRLRPLTVYTPKPLVPILNRPLLMYQIDLLRKAGITEITLSLSYQPDKIEHTIGNGSELGVRLRYITEPTPLGTAGAYRFAADASSEATIVLNGDVLTDLALSEVIEFHKTRKADATIALAPVEDSSRYGVVNVADDGRILTFVEKPADGAIESAENTVNAGVYILEPAILGLIPKDTNRSFEYHVFPDMLARSMPFYGFVMKDEYWLDIGTPESYLKGHLDLLAGNVKLLDPVKAFDSDIATHAEVDKRCVIGDGSTIKPGARVTNSVIGPGVHIEEKAFVENSVIWSHTRIASFAEVRHSIVGRSCHIGRNAVVGEGSVLGDKTSLTDYTRV